MKLIKKNTDMSDILIKVATLNDFYSTHILNIFKVAEHIQKLKTLTIDCKVAMKI